MDFKHNALNSEKHTHLGRFLACGWFSDDLTCYKAKLNTKYKMKKSIPHSACLKAIFVPVISGTSSVRYNE